MIKKVLISIIDIVMISLTVLSAQVLHYPASLADLAIAYSGFGIVILAIIRVLLTERKQRFNLMTFLPIVAGSLIIVCFLIPRSSAQIICYVIILMVLSSSIDNWFIENPMRKAFRHIYNYFKMPELK